MLVRHLADLPVSRSKTVHWIEAGRVTVAAAVARRAAQRVRSGDSIEVRGLPIVTPHDPLEAEVMSLAIVWEDEHLLAVNKPAGLVVHPSYRRRTGTLLNGLLEAAKGWADPSQRPRTVHRLDQHTSGLLLVAKSAAAQSGLARAFQRRLVDKDYLAVTAGLARQDHGHIDAPIGREPNHPRRRQVDGVDARPATTSWREVARSQDWDANLVLCRPHTGRTHQIRVHLASVGMPLLGDRLYASDRPTRLPPTAQAFDRQALHAWRLRLRHPVTGADLDFTAPLPADLRGLLDLLGIAQPSGNT